MLLAQVKESEHMALDTKEVVLNEKEARRASTLKTLAAIQAWPYWEEVFLNCIKESPMTPEAFAEAVKWGDSSRAGFEKAMQASQHDPDEITFLLIWRQVNQSRESQRQEALAALMADFAEVLDWDNAHMQEGRGLLHA
jgi:hypothetical protein